MGLSNSIRELLLENIERNNYVNDLIPVSKHSEFSIVEKLHHKTIEASKKIKVSKKNSVKSELIVDKIEELSDDDDDDDESMSDKIESIKESYSDLNTSVLNNIEYVDENMETVIEPSQDLSSEQIDEPVPLLDESDTSKPESDMVSKTESDIVSKPDTTKSEPDMVSKTESNIESKSGPDMVSKSDMISNSQMDTDFFAALSNIENKSSEVKQTHKSSNIPQTTDLSGGANTKVIKLTEKYDFF